LRLITGANGVGEHPPLYAHPLGSRLSDLVDESCKNFDSEC
jgi:hypothetical protein